MNNRTDLKVDLLGSLVELTGKVMPNGETRRRVRLGDLTLHVTTSVEGGWQDAHYHKGVTEHYLVVKGRMAGAWQEHRGDETLKYVTLVETGETVTTDIDERHNVYLYPDTTIVTVVFGSPIGNVEKGGNDWWPSSGKFDRWSKGLSQEDIKRMVG